MKLNVVDAPIERVIRDVHQPRKAFKQAELDELAASIREHGIIQPLTVRVIAHDGQPAYEVIAGERRLRAAVLAGLKTVPVIVREFDDDSRKAIQILENVARSDLNPMEEAEAFHELQMMGMDVEEIAPKVGKSAAYVSARLSFLRLDTSLGALLRSGQMNTTTAYQLARLEGEKQHKAAKAWLDNGLSTAALTKLVEHLLVEQEPMFGEDQAPIRRAEAKAVRGRVDRAIQSAIEAINSTLDKRTLELLPEAVAGDTTVMVQRLQLLERAVANLRAEVEASGARPQQTTGDLWDQPS